MLFLIKIFSAVPALAETPSITPTTIALNVPFLGVATVSNFGEYLIRMYQLVGSLIISAAIVLIMWGGIIWVTSADSGRVKQAKGYITMAVTGLVFYLFSYMILAIVNPDVLRVDVFKVTAAQIESTDAESQEDVEPTALDMSSLVRISGNNIVVTSVASDPRVTPETLAKLQRAASQLYEKGYQLLITSAFRSPETQVATLKKNCPSAAISCTPDFVCTVQGTCNILTCKMSKGPTSCPHTTGRALDVWAGKQGSQMIGQTTCVADKEACRRAPGQAELIVAMRAAGFCNLCAEPWHFESPKMSACCN